MSKLTIKQENFCNYYLECGNASEAYRRAFSCKNMKPETINRNAFDLLNNNKIATRIKEFQEQLQKKSDITKDEAVKELSNIVRVNPLDYIDITNKQVLIVKDLSKLSIEQQRCIKSISPVRGGIKIGFESKIAAIDRLSKMLGWDSTERMELSLKDQNINIAVVDSNISLSSNEDDVEI